MYFQIATNLIATHTLYVSSTSQWRERFWSGSDQETSLKELLGSIL